MKKYIAALAAFAFLMGTPVVTIARAEDEHAITNKAEKDAKLAQKDIEKAAKKAEKEAKKQQKALEKQAKKAKKEAEKQAKEAEKKLKKAMGN